jgi:ankyrin repeat protein
VAKKFGHREMLEFLLERCPPDEKLLNACWLGDEALVKSLLARNPNLAGELNGTQRAAVADAARNNNVAALRLMLVAGLPADSFSQQHHATPLHWAAFHGSVEMLRLLLEREAPVDNKDNEYGGTAIDWALHGSENGWNRAKGDYPAVIELLVAAGSPLPFQPRGSAKVREALRRHGVTYP